MQSQWIAIVGTVVLASAAPAAHAEWKGKGEAGILFARGNTDTDTINIKVDMSREVDRWKNEFGLSAIRAASNGDATAKRYEGHWQTDYKLSERSFWFGGLRYEKDEFGGFDYQASLATGYGYKFVDTESTKFSGQIGAGYRRIKNALDGSTSDDERYPGAVGGSRGSLQHEAAGDQEDNGYHHDCQFGVRVLTKGRLL
jgi:putative salt-induced outer membrane protein